VGIITKKKKPIPFYKKIDIKLQEKGIDDLMVYRYYINHSITVGGSPISSPLPNRIDKRPSFGIYSTRQGDIRFKDLATGVNGNKFEFVKQLFSLSFQEACIKVIEDFNLDIPYTKSKSSRTIERTVSTLPKKEKIKVNRIKLTVAIRCNSKNIPIYTKQDIVYWKKRKIDNVPYRLKRNRTYSARMVYRNGVSFWGYLKNNPIYAYLYKHNGINYWKVYRPLSKDKSMKFYNDMKGITPYCIDGIWNLPEKGDILIITKSRKDVICLDELGFNVIGIAAEGNTKPIANEIYNNLLGRFNNIYLLYDNDWDKKDNWGQINANKVVNRYERMNNIFIPSEYKCSDTDELMVKYDKNKVKQIITNLL